MDFQNCQLLGKIQTDKHLKENSNHPKGLMK